MISAPRSAPTLDDLAAELRAGRAKVREDATGLFVEDRHGWLYWITQAGGRSGVGWVAQTIERCLASVDLAGRSWPDRDFQRYAGQCGNPAMLNGLCDRHGGEGEGQTLPVGVWCSSVAYLRFLAWCAEQRAENRQRIDTLCRDMTEP